MAVTQNNQDKQREHLSVPSQEVLLPRIHHKQSGQVFYKENEMWKISKYEIPESFKSNPEAMAMFEEKLVRNNDGSINILNSDLESTPEKYVHIEVGLSQEVREKTKRGQHYQASCDEQMRLAELICEALNK